eukprot:6932660-Prymnesium_polylepis.2
MGLANQRRLAYLRVALHRDAHMARASLCRPSDQSRALQQPAIVLWQEPILSGTCAELFAELFTCFGRKERRIDGKSQIDFVLVEREVLRGAGAQASGVWVRRARARAEFVNTWVEMGCNWAAFT